MNNSAKFAPDEMSLTFQHEYIPP